MTRTPIAAEKDAWLPALSKAEEALSSGPAWVRPLRQEALARFRDLGFPPTRLEEWKYTNVQPISKTAFTVAEFEGPRGTGAAQAARAGLTEERIGDLAFGRLGAVLLVFVNGRYAPDLSHGGALPPGVEVLSLAEVIETRRALVEPHLARLAGIEGRHFVALNTALMADGACVIVPKGRAVEEPIQILFLSAPTNGPLAVNPRVLVVAGEGSRATIVESYAGAPDAVYFTNAVTEIAAADGAAVEHYKIQREGDRAFHVGAIQARLGRDAVLASHSLSFGAALARHDVNVVLEAEGADCTLNGLYVVAGAQHVDHHTLIDHARPRGSSRELYKGILDGRARGVFDGKIVVRKDAQKTDARQVNKNLLLSDQALADTKPQLEINADDVKCSHAATVGQLDADALFYLRCRGVGEQAARALLMHGFVGDVLGRVKVVPIREALEGMMLRRLAGGAPAARPGPAGEARR